MPNEPDSTARKRFARDLRRIREDREVSLAVVHDRTQAPQSRLQAFEEGNLLDRPRMNRVYLRAFVRAYAEAIGLSPEPVLDHFEAALDNQYTNELAVQVLDASPSASRESPQPSEDSVSETVPSDSEEAGPDNLDPEVSSADPEPPPQKTQVGPGEGRSVASSTDPSDERNSIRPEESSSRPSSSGAPPSGADRAFWGEYRTTLGFTTAGVLFAVVVGGLMAWYLQAPAPPTSPEPSEQAAAAPAADSGSTTDTTAKSPSSPNPSPAAVRLGDTLHLTVVAMSPVREMRVQQDDDLRRPYWIREGEALVFPFTKRITVENQLDSLRLLLERYPYPASKTDTAGRVVIQRSTAQQFADTLRGPPASIPGSPDTVALRNPPAIESERPSPASDSVETGRSGSGK